MTNLERSAVSSVGNESAENEFCVSFVGKAVESRFRVFWNHPLGSRLAHSPQKGSSVPVESMQVERFN